MKKKLLLFIFVFLFFSFGFSQSSENSSKLKDTFHSFFNKADMNLEMSPCLYLNTESWEHSALSPIVYPFTLGVTIPNNTLISFSPAVSFYSMFYNYYDGMALPAEIENRTATALSFMITLPANFSFDVTGGKFQIFAGPAVFARIALKAYGINESDSGYTGSAKSDIEAINKYFWSKSNFLYAGLGFSYVFDMTGNFRIGPVTNIYLPLGSFFNGKGVQGMMINAGIKLSY